MTTMNPSQLCMMRDDTKCASTAYENLSQGPLVFDQLILAEQNAVVSSTSDGNVPTTSNTFQGFPSTSATPFQNRNNDAGVNESSLEQLLNSDAAQDGVFNDLFTFAQDNNAMASTDDLAHIDASWDDMFDFGPAVAMQDIQDFGLQSDIQSFGKPSFGQVMPLRRNFCHIASNFNTRTSHCNQPEHSQLQLHRLHEELLSPRRPRPSCPIAQSKCHPLCVS